MAHAVLLSLWLLASSAPASTRIITPLDYFEDGRRAVDEFLDARSRQPMSAELAAHIERSKQRCVRIELIFPIDDETHRSIMASGVILAGGHRVLTAGHSFSGRSPAEVRVTLTDGQTLRARVASSRYQLAGDITEDWAILEFVDPPDLTLPHLAIGPVREHRLVFVLGYPENIGIDAAGDVAFGSDRPGEALEPLVTVGRVKTTDPVMLVPHAGAIPTGGMSGGPAFDRHGRLVGIFLSILHGSSPASYAYRMAPAAALHERLAAAELRVPPGPK